MALRVQKITKSFPDALQVAIKYYSIICILNNISLTERELQLLAFTSIRGTISSLSAKEEFSKVFGSSVASVNNMISKLKSIGLLRKIQNKYRVNPQLALEFAKQDIGLVLILKKTDVSDQSTHTQGETGQ